MRLVGDNFTCNTCELCQQQPPASIPGKQGLHVYTHPLVRCKERVEDPSPLADPTMSELGERVGKLEELMNIKIGQLREHSRLEISQLEERLEERIDQFQVGINSRLQRVEEGLEMLGRLIGQLVEPRRVSDQ